MSGRRERDDEGREHAPRMPRTYGDPDGLRDEGGAGTLALEVDGERFHVRVVVDPATGYTDTGYTWLSGPNEGYGFGIGGPPNPSLEEHRQRIREFLSMVDPSTGYIEAD